MPATTLGQDNSQPNQPDTSAQAESKPAIVVDSTTLRTIFDEAVQIFRDEKAANHESEERKERSDAADLVAQQDMALWAKFMFIVAVIQLPITSATLWFLYLTFRETRRTADAAVQAASASIGAERAWLLLVIDDENFDMVLARFGPELFRRAIYRDCDPRPWVKFHFHNFGKTPAFVKAISARVDHWTHFPRSPVYQPDLPMPTETIIGAGGDLPTMAPIRDEQGEIVAAVGPLTRQSQIEIDETATDSIRNGRSFIWFHGQIVYDDVWGNEHVTRFRWEYNGALGWFTQSGGKPYNEAT